MPSSAFPEIRLRSAGVVPPIVAPAAPTSMPSSPFSMGAVPAALVPM
jgi:hypothetical protein